MTEAPRATEQGSRAFAGALAFVGIICIAYPLADLVLNTWPLVPSDLAWRYQFVGLMSQLLITPLIGVAFLAGAGILHQGGPFLRMGGVLSLVTGGLVVLLTVVFFLDGLQLRSMIGPDELSVFQLSTLRAVVKNVITALGFLYVGYGAVKASAAMKDKARGSDGPGVVARA